MRGIYAEWRDGWKGLPYVWRAVALFAGLTMGQLFSHAIGAYPAPFDVANALIYVAILMPFIATAQIVVLLIWRSRSDPGAR